jgi:hypothetical protein
MKFPATTSAVFFFDVGRTKIVLSTPLRSSPICASIPRRWAPRWQTTNRMPFGFEARHPGWIVMPTVGHRFLRDGHNRLRTVS